MRCCCSPLGGAGGGGGGFAPIQNTRFLDPTFAGTSTGSIGAPYAELAPFLAELAGSERGWELWLPPDPDLLGGVVPAFGDGGGLVLRGLSPAMTYVGNAWTIANQTAGQPQMDFHDLGLSLLEAQGGTVHFELVNCFVDSFDVAALAGGSGRFRNSQCTGCNWPTDGFSFEVFGGSLNGACSWDDGRFYNVQLGAGSSFTPGNSEQWFAGCTFDGGITISNANTPTLVMDQFSYASFVENGVTFAGSVRVRGVLRGVTGLVSVNVPANSTAFQDFPVLGMTASHRVIANINNTPPTGLGIAAVWATPGADNIRVWFLNTTAADIPGGSFAISYWATL